MGSISIDKATPSRIQSRNSQLWIIKSHIGTEGAPEGTRRHQKAPDYIGELIIDVYKVSIINPKSKWPAQTVD